MSDDNNPFSAYNFVRRWGSQQRENERRDSLFGGRAQQYWASAPITDVKAVVTSFAGMGLMIGMFIGTISAPSNNIPILQGFLTGSAKGAAIGAAIGFAIAKAAFVGGLGHMAAKEAMTRVNLMTNGFLGTAWRGAKWGGIVGGAGSLMTGNTGAIVEWIVPMAGIGAVTGVGVKAGKNVLDRLRGS